MAFFYKIVKNLAPKYLQSYLLYQVLNQYPTRSANKSLLTALPSRTLSFSNTFFPYCINEWNKLNDNLINENSIYKFKNYLTKFIKVKENSSFSISDPLGLKLLTRLRLNFSRLNEHKLRHNFRNTVNPMYSCGAAIEKTDPYLLRCQNSVLFRLSFLNRSFEINAKFRNMNNLTLTYLQLFGSEKQAFDVNTKILNIKIQFLKDSARFDEPLI